MAGTPPPTVSGGSSGTPPPTTGGTTGTPPPTTGNPPPQQWTPEYLSQLFPNGIPQVGVNQFIQQILQGALPQFQQQDRALTEGLANAGIMGGSTTGAVGQLGLQQQQQLTGELAPSVLDINKFNVGNKIGAGMFDATAFNNLLSQVMGMQNQDWLGQLGAMSGFGMGQAGAFSPIWAQSSGAPWWSELASGLASAAPAAGTGTP